MEDLDIRQMDDIIAKLSVDLVSYNDHFNADPHRAHVSAIYPNAPYVKGEGWVLTEKPDKSMAIEEISRAPELSKQVTLGRDSTQEIPVEIEQSKGPRTAAEIIMAQHTLDFDRDFGEVCKHPKSANECLVIQAARTLLPSDDFEAMKNTKGIKVGDVMKDLKKVVAFKSAFELVKQDLRQHIAHAHDHDVHAPANMLSAKSGILAGLQEGLSELHHPSKDELGKLHAPSTPAGNMPEKSAGMGRIKG
jgi:hypothetical protein